MSPAAWKGVVGCIGEVTTTTTTTTIQDGAQSYSNTKMGHPPPDGITCDSTAHCPTSGACAENPVCWTHESPNGHHYCAEQVTPGSSGTTTDICSDPAAQDYIQCWQGKAQRYCRHSYDYSNTVMGRPPPDGITCDSTADCPTSGACAENPVCW